MNAFAGIRPNVPRGVKTQPPIAFFPGVCSGGYLFSSGGPTPTTLPPPIFTLVPDPNCRLTLDSYRPVYFLSASLYFSNRGAYYGRPLSVSGRPCYILPMFF